jgi:predicted N-acetyltransferase YhbS
MTISVRHFTDADTEAVLDVMRASLGETEVLQRNQRLFDWKHIENPFGRSIMLVATEADQIVGFRAFMRWTLQTPSGDQIRCVRPVDTATHPEHRRKGIFRELTESAVEEARADGVHLIFNTPNAQSGAGYLKMGWSTVGAIGAMVRPGWRFIGTTRHLAADYPVTILSEEDRAPRGLRTVRSSEYRTWRFTKHPTARYAQVGSPAAHLICRLNNRAGYRELVVSESVGDTSSALKTAMRALEAHYAVGWFPPGSDERSELIRAGFIPVPKLKALQLACRPLADVSPDPTDLLNWDVGFGDLELL